MRKLENAFWLSVIALAVGNVAFPTVVVILGLSDTNFTIYPPSSWLGWVLLIFNSVMLPIAAFLAVGLQIRLRPHPYTSISFWVSFLGFLIVAFAVGPLLDRLGSPASGYDSDAARLGSRFRLLLLGSILLITILWTRHKLVVMGLSFGIALYFVLLICSILS